MTQKSVIVLTDSNQLEAILQKTKCLELTLPSRLRLIRSALTDNGFCGVRTITSERAFIRDVLQDENFITPELAEKLQDDADAVLEDQNEILKPLTALAAGEYLVISPGASAKYLVCGPKDCWKALVSDNAIYLLATKRYTSVLCTPFASLI